MRFAHIADCHLGSWRQPELQQLNLASFNRAIEICIEERVNFIVFSGDLFDSAYPPIEILKETFSEFRKLKEAGIKCYIIAGSHDYSVSGKTFLDVLEKAGFCQICEFEESSFLERKTSEKEGKEKSEGGEKKESEGKENEEKKILLKAHNCESISIYGYPGKKSGLEIDDLKKISLESSNKFKILMLHTTMESAKGTLPVESVSIKELPEADYYALGHLHLIHEYKLADNRYLIYPGPIFPNNFQELEELRGGSFYIIDVNGYVKLTKKELKLKEVLTIELEIENALTATDKIISVLEKQEIADKVILLKLKGTIKQGKIADIKFQDIEKLAKGKKAYALLKNTNCLKTEEPEATIEIDNIDKIEATLIEDFVKKTPSEFNNFVPQLINSFNLEKQEDEKSVIFESRLLLEINKILELK